MIAVVDTVAGTRDSYLSIHYACEAAYQAVERGESDRLEIRCALNEIIGECRSTIRDGQRAVVTEGDAWRPSGWPTLW